MTYDRECLYDVEWQLLRVSLLAVNATDGGFGSHEGVANNLIKLQTYVNAATDHEFYLRCHRVRNLLAATLFGYGEKFPALQGRIKAAHDEYASLLGDNTRSWRTRVWDWGIVAYDLAALYRYSPKDFGRIRFDMHKRFKTATRKEKKGTGGMQHRPELEKFISMMDAIMGADKS